MLKYQKTLFFKSVFTIIMKSAFPSRRVGPTDFAGAEPRVGLTGFRG